jgi:hypothetical protein
MHPISCHITQQVKRYKAFSILSVHVGIPERDTGPHLIVVPKSTLINWMNKIAPMGYSQTSQVPWRQGITLGSLIVNDDKTGTA